MKGYHPSKFSAVAVLLAATTQCSSAFQVRPPLNLPSRVLTPTRIISFASTLPNNNGRLLHPLRGANDDSEVDVTQQQQENLPVKADNTKNIFHQLYKIKLPLATIIVSLAIFLLPLFISSAAWAVQSGGRIGGSVGGSSRQNSGSYGGGSYSRGYSRGYSSGYYSRPSVVVSPGISPYYR